MTTDQVNKKTDDPDSLGTRGSPLLVPDEKIDDPDSLGTRGSPILVPDEGLVSSEPKKQVVPPPRQTCDNPAGTTSGVGNSPDEAVPKKRRWRPYNRVWRRDQKWTREGLTYPQKPPVSQKSVEPVKVSSETRSPPPLVSDEVVPKQKKRHWTYNRVWHKDKKWIREEQTQRQAVPPPTPVQRDHPTMAPPVPVPKQHEPPQFLRNYWRRNRVWRRDMVWVRKPTPEPRMHAADEAQDLTLVPSSEKTASSMTTDSKEQSRTPTTDTAGSSPTPDITPTEGQETGSSSATDGEPSPPAASDAPPLPPSDELKTTSDRTHGKQSGVEDQKEGETPPTSGLRSTSLCCTEKQQTGVENQSTRKRKRPSCPCVPSKRQKTAMFSPMEIEMQCLVQMFAAWSL